MKKTLKKIADRKQSVSNSQFASEYLEAQGLGVEKVAELIKGLAESNQYVFDRNGRLTQKVPDIKSRGKAAELLTKIHGFEHQPEQKTSITVDQINAVTEITNYDVKSLMDKEKEAKEVLHRAQRFQLPDA